MERKVVVCACTTCKPVDLAGRQLALINNLGNQYREGFRGNWTSDAKLILECKTECDIRMAEFCFGS